MSVYQLDLNKPVHVHFIGIGGISMSGIAHILLANGFKISGSDMNKSAVTDELEALGATIKTPQKADNITDDIDLVVYTAAIHPDNPEYQECKKEKYSYGDTCRYPRSAYEELRQGNLCIWNSR